MIVGIAMGIYWDIQENERIDAEAVTYKEDLTVEFGENVKVSDFLANLNGELLDDYTINTTKLGEQKITFDFTNIKNKKRTRDFTIKVVDTTAPKIYGNNNYVVNVGFDGDLTDFMLSGDNADDEPQREIMGNYDFTKEGSYPLTYKISDASGNTAEHNFTLKVVPPSTEAPTTETSEKYPIEDLITEYKTTQTKIGVDVSQWQGEIDWRKVKKAGVEFAFIRVGYQAGYDGEYILDPYFVRNVTEANKIDLPVGVYFYSYATNTEEAERQADWVIEQIKEYDVELGVAFDWEDWRNFNKTKMSFYTINRVAYAYLDKVAAAGYTGWLYGSKNYLEKIWQPEEYPVWLAQYFHIATYDDEYNIWQISDAGQVDGIYGAVDLDIMYIEKER